MATPAPGGGNSADKVQALIYVVDDEPMLLELATAILEPQGYFIKTFRDPEMALQTYLVDRPKPEIVVTDFAMLGMNGMQLITQIRRQEPAQCIILVSGTVGEDIYGTSPIKPDYFLAKPYQPEQLIDVVKLALKKSK